MEYQFGFYFRKFKVLLMRICNVTAAMQPNIKT